MILTNTEYMSEPARVERVVRKFMNMTLRELRNTGTKKYLDYIIGTVTSGQGLSIEKGKDMSYAELACLIDKMGGDPRYDFFDLDSFTEQRLCYKMLAYTLTEGSRASIPVRMFSMIPLKAFYEYRCLCLSGREPADEFPYIEKCCGYKEGYTIKDFILEKTKVLERPWSLNGPLEEYEETVLDAYDDLGRLLVGSFRQDADSSYDTNGKEENSYE